jgi:hypothetical protein
MIRTFFIVMSLTYTLIGSGQKPKSHSNDDIQEDKIIDRLYLLPEIKEKNRYIDSFTNHKHGIAFITMKKPNSKSDYYWIQAGYNSDIRFEPYYNFYVYYPKMKIEVLDPSTDKVYSLKDWRKRNSSH